jgi:hypothetical protein
LYGHFSTAGAAESLIWLEPKRSGSSTAKIKFSRKLSQKFRTFAKIFSQKRKLNFAKTFVKKKRNRKLSSPPQLNMLQNHIIFTLIWLLFNSFSNTNKQNFPLSDFFLEFVTKSKILFSRKFRLFVKNLLWKRKVNFAKTFAKKRKRKLSSQP